MTLLRGWLPGTNIELGSFLEPTADNGYGYQATVAGITGTSEPDWPLGGSVVDGSVTWTAVTSDYLEWRASPLMTSGTTQPSWPEVFGTVFDHQGTRYITRTPEVTDSKCPHSRIAIAMSQKIYSPQDDVMRYSATNLARDWSTQDDAGFLPTGMHAPREADITAVGEYRGRLVAFSPGSMQVWTTDPDPLEQALFDNIDGIGCVEPACVASVSGDLFFLTPAGIRSLSIAAGAQNLQAGDIGTSIDELVKAAMAGSDGENAFAFYYPGMGQFWLCFGQDVFVYSQSKIGKVGGWSRYYLLQPIYDATTLDGVLYVRNSGTVARVDEEATTDWGYDLDDGTPFAGTVWWPHLDFNTPWSKFLHHVDVVSRGTFEISIGHDQVLNPTDPVTGYTPYPPYDVMDEASDTLVTTPIKIPLIAPSFAPKITFGGGQRWELLAISMTYQELTGQP